MFSLPLYVADSDHMSAFYQALFRWSALIFTTPVVFYSARPFFRNAIIAAANVNAHGLAMDVPVALAIAVAYAASVLATVAGHGDVYFDSVTMFVFLLLGARYLEQQHAPSLGAFRRLAGRCCRQRRVASRTTASRRSRCSAIRPGRSHSGRLRFAHSDRRRDRRRCDAGRRIDADGRVATRREIDRAARVCRHAERGATDPRRRANTTRADARRRNPSARAARDARQTTGRAARRSGGATLRRRHPAARMRDISRVVRNRRATRVARRDRRSGRLVPLRAVVGDSDRADRGRDGVAPPRIRRDARPRHRAARARLTRRIRQDRHADGRASRADRGEDIRRIVGRCVHRNRARARIRRHSSARRRVRCHRRAAAPRARRAHRAGQRNRRPRRWRCVSPRQCGVLRDRRARVAAGADDVLSGEHSRADRDTDRARRVRRAHGAAR